MLENLIDVPKFHFLINNDFSAEQVLVLIKEFLQLFLFVDDLDAHRHARVVPIGAERLNIFVARIAGVCAVGGGLHDTVLFRLLDDMQVGGLGEHAAEQGTLTMSYFMRRLDIDLELSERMCFDLFNHCFLFFIRVSLTSFNVLL